jgi:hypothetical protein
VSLAAMSLCFAPCMFGFLPDAPVHFRDVWIGALFTAVFFEIGKFLVGFVSQPGPPSPRRTVRPVRSSSCCCGCTTRRRSFFGAELARHGAGEGARHHVADRQPG